MTAEPFPYDPHTPPEGAVEVDVVVTPAEVNDRHGTGIYLRTLFPDDSNILSIRTRDLYGAHDFGQVSRQLNLAELAAGEAGATQQEAIAKAVRGYWPRRVLCVPYFAEDLLLAVGIARQFGCPLGIYLMDDRNVQTEGIDDELMREALSLSGLVLAISQPMAEAYREKFDVTVHYVPPLVNPQQLHAAGAYDAGPRGSHIASGKSLGLIIGNIWSPVWAHRLMDCLTGSGVELDWVGGATRKSVKLTDEELARRGLHYHGFVPESELLRRVRCHPFAVMPTGFLGEGEPLPHIARLSLPSRLVFLMAAGNLPVLVIGHPDTGAARFVEEHGIGLVCPYEAEALRAAVAAICDPSSQARFRARAREFAPHFSAARLAGERFWQAIETGSLQEKFS